MSDVHTGQGTKRKAGYGRDMLLLRPDHDSTCHCSTYMPECQPVQMPFRSIVFVADSAYERSKRVVVYDCVPVRGFASRARRMTDILRRSWWS